MVLFEVWYGIVGGGNSLFALSFELPKLIGYAALLPKWWWIISHWKVIVSWLVGINCFEIATLLVHQASKWVASALINIWVIFLLVDRGILKQFATNPCILCWMHVIWVVLMLFWKYWLKFSFIIKLDWKPFWVIWQEVNARRWGCWNSRPISRI